MVGLPEGRERYLRRRVQEVHIGQQCSGSQEGSGTTVGTTDTLRVTAEQQLESCFHILGTASLRRLVPANINCVEFEEDAFESAEGVPDLECPAKADCDFEFRSEEVFLRYYRAGSGGSGDEGFDGSVVVFRLGREVKDEEEDVFGVEGEGGGGEVEAVQEGQCRCLANTL